MNDPSYVIIIQGLKKCIVCFFISIKFLGSNFGPRVLITHGYTKRFGHCFYSPASYGLQEHSHLNLPYEKVKAIRLRRGLNSFSHFYYCG